VYECAGVKVSLSAVSTTIYKNTITQKKVQSSVQYTRVITCRDFYIMYNSNILVLADETGLYTIRQYSYAVQSEVVQLWPDLIK